MSLWMLQFQQYKYGIIAIMHKPIIYLPSKLENNCTEVLYKLPVPMPNSYFHLEILKISDQKILHSPTANEIRKGVQSVLSKKLNAQYAHSSVCKKSTTGCQLERMYSYSYEHISRWINHFRWNTKNW